MDVAESANGISEFVLHFFLHQPLGLKTFGVYFFSGYVPWIFFSNVTVGATTAIVGNSLYVTRIYAPRLIFPLATVAVNLVDFGAGLAILLALVLVMGAPLTAAWLSSSLWRASAGVFAASRPAVAAMASSFAISSFSGPMSRSCSSSSADLYPVERLRPARVSTCN